LRRWRLFSLAVAAIGSTAATAAASGATAAPVTTRAGTGTVISAVDGPFGRMLVVGSGKYQGFTLYAITSDYSEHYGCTTKVMSILGHNGSCTGPSNDQNAEWPAITTTGAPVAGPGVSARQYDHWLAASVASVMPSILILRVLLRSSPAGAVNTAALCPA
jgi:hypothetical protein